MYAFSFSPLFFLLIILLYFFPYSFSIMPNFSADIVVWSWLVSFPHLLHPSFSYLKYLTDFDEAVATLNIKISFQRCRLVSVQLLDVSVLAVAFCLYIGTSQWKMKARSMIMQLYFLSLTLKSKGFKAYQFGFLVKLYSTGFANKK